MPRPKKAFKSLDDDDDVTNILEVAENLDKDDDETVLAPDDIPTEETEIAEKEDVSVSGDSISITSIRSNAPPPQCWSDKIKTKFSVGELVTIKGLPDSIYKIMHPCAEPFTYAIKPSGTDAVRNNVAEDKLRKAKPDAKWVSYWDTVVDPFRDWQRKQQEALKATPVPPKSATKKKKKK
jgi:hypothetical protein